jgi:hypothetical protein
MRPSPIPTLAQLDHQQVVLRLRDDGGKLGAARVLSTGAPRAVGSAQPTPDLDDAGVPQPAEDLDLPPELVLGVGLVLEGPVDHLHRVRLPRRWVRELVDPLAPGALA